VAGSCIYAVLKTDGEGEDYIPSMVGAILIGGVIRHLLRMPVIKSG